MVEWRWFFTAWVLFGAIEVLLVGKVDPQETPVGLAVAALAAAASARVLRASRDRYRVRLRWVALVPAIVRNVVRDTLTLFAIVLRRLGGAPLPDDRTLEIPFDPGSDDPESNARRALAVAAVCCGPNTLVLDIRREDRTMRVHYLDARAQRPASAQWPL